VRGFKVRSVQTADLARAQQESGSTGKRSRAFTEPTSDLGNGRVTGADEHFNGSPTLRSSGLFPSGRRSDRNVCEWLSRRRLIQICQGHNYGTDCGS
jgi:hypothetical protein